MSASYEIMMGTLDIKNAEFHLGSLYALETDAHKLIQYYQRFSDHETCQRASLERLETITSLIQQKKLTLITETIKGLGI